MCVTTQCDSGGAAACLQTAEAASQQGLNAQSARMQTFPDACHAYERVIPTRLTPVLSKLAALQQYDLRRPPYRATRRHSAVTD
jgi:hypothetical protein